MKYSAGYYLCWRRGHIGCLLHNIKYWFHGVAK